MIDRDFPSRTSEKIETIILCLNFGLKTGWALKNLSGHIQSGIFDGSGECFVNFANFLEEIHTKNTIDRLYFTQAPKSKGIHANYLYNCLATMLQNWNKKRLIPYSAAPIKLAKKHVAGRGNASAKALIWHLAHLGYQTDDIAEAQALALLLYVLEMRINKRHGYER